MPTEPHNATVVYPGGIRARWRWAGSGQGPEVFALSEAGGGLLDVGEAAGPGFESLCRAELRADVPGGAWTVRFASTIYDEPAAVAWDSARLLVVKYGFHAFGIEARTGAERWRHRSATPILAVLGSSRLPHVLVQSELETFALDPDGSVAWRIAHSDVVTEAVLVGGRLVLTSFAGQHRALDPETGRTAG
jgi:outer membrane protein assembly factor BamB